MYFQLDENQQIYQTETSINAITQQFNLDYKTFSFPFTDFKVSNHFFEQIFKDGDAIADLTFGCAGMKEDSCWRNRQRIPIEIASFSASDVIFGEYLYFMLKALLNKNKIRRK